MREREIKWGESVLAWAWGKLSNIYVWHCDCETETPVPVHHSGAHQCVNVPRPSSHCHCHSALYTGTSINNTGFSTWGLTMPAAALNECFECVSVSRRAFRASSASLSLSLVFGLQLISRALRVKSFFFSSHYAFTLPSCLCPACLWFQLNALN